MASFITDLRNRDFTRYNKGLYPPLPMYAAWAPPLPPATGPSESGGKAGTATSAASAGAGQAGTSAAATATAPGKPAGGELPGSSPTSASGAAPLLTAEEANARRQAISVPGRFVALFDKEAWNALQARVTAKTDRDRKQARKDEHARRKAAKARRRAASSGAARRSGGSGAGGAGGGGGRSRSYGSGAAVPAPATNALLAVVTSAKLARRPVGTAGFVEVSHRFRGEVMDVSPPSVAASMPWAIEETRCTVCGVATEFTAEEVHAAHDAAAVKKAAGEGKPAPAPSVQCAASSHQMVSCGDCGVKCHTRCGGLWPHSFPALNALLTPGGYRCDLCKARLEHAAPKQPGGTGASSSSSSSSSSLASPPAGPLEDERCLMCKRPPSGLLMMRTATQDRLVHAVCLLTARCARFPWGQRATLRGADLSLTLGPKPGDVDSVPTHLCMACGNVGAMAVMPSCSCVHKHATYCGGTRMHASCALQRGVLTVAHWTFGALSDTTPELPAEAQDAAAASSAAASASASSSAPASAAVPGAWDAPCPLPPPVLLPPHLTAKLTAAGGDTDARGYEVLSPGDPYRYNAVWYTDLDLPLPSSHAFFDGFMTSIETRHKRGALALPVSAADSAPGGSGGWFPELPAAPRVTLAQLEAGLSAEERTQAVLAAASDLLSPGSGLTLAQLSNRVKCQMPPPSTPWVMSYRFRCRAHSLLGQWQLPVDFDRLFVGTGAGTCAGRVVPHWWLGDGSSNAVPAFKRQQLAMLPLGKLITLPPAPAPERAAAGAQSGAGASSSSAAVHVTAQAEGGASSSAQAAAPPAPSPAPRYEVEGAPNAPWIQAFGGGDGLWKAVNRAFDARGPLQGMPRILDARYTAWGMSLDQWLSVQKTPGYQRGLTEARRKWLETQPQPIALPQELEAAETVPVPVRSVSRGHGKTAAPAAAPAAAGAPAAGAGATASDSAASKLAGASSKKGKAVTFDPSARGAVSPAPTGASSNAALASGDAAKPAGAPASKAAAVAASLWVPDRCETGPWKREAKERWAAAIAAHGLSSGAALAIAQAVGTRTVKQVRDKLCDERRNAAPAAAASSPGGGGARSPQPPAPPGVTPGATVLSALAAADGASAAAMEVDEEQGGTDALSAGDARELDAAREGVAAAAASSGGPAPASASAPSGSPDVDVGSSSDSSSSSDEEEDDEGMGNRKLAPAPSRTAPVAASRAAAKPAAAKTAACAASSAAPGTARPTPSSAGTNKRAHSAAMAPSAVVPGAAAASPRVNNTSSRKPTGAAGAAEPLHAYAPLSGLQSDSLAAEELLLHFGPYRPGQLVWWRESLVNRWPAVVTTPRSLAAAGFSRAFVQEALEVVRVENAQPQAAAVAGKAGAASGSKLAPKPSASRKVLVVFPFGGECATVTMCGEAALAPFVGGCNPADGQALILQQQQAEAASSAAQSSSPPAAPALPRMDPLMPPASRWAKQLKAEMREAIARAEWARAQAAATAPAGGMVPSWACEGESVMLVSRDGGVDPAASVAAVAVEAGMPVVRVRGTVADEDDGPRRVFEAVPLCVPAAPVEGVAFPPPGTECVLVPLWRVMPSQVAVDRPPAFTALAQATTSQSAAPPTAAASQAAAALEEVPAHAAASAATSGVPVAPVASDTGAPARLPASGRKDKRGRDGSEKAATSPLVLTATASKPVPAAPALTTPLGLPQHGAGRDAVYERVTQAETVEKAAAVLLAGPAAGPASTGGAGMAQLLPQSLPPQPAHDPAGSLSVAVKLTWQLQGETPAATTSASGAPSAPTSAQPAIAGTGNSKKAHGGVPVSAPAVAFGAAAEAAVPASASAASGSAATAGGRRGRRGGGGDDLWCL